LYSTADAAKPRDQGSARERRSRATALKNGVAFVMETGRDALSLGVTVPEPVRPSKVKTWISP
jgi:hypothetical protein